MQQLKRLSSPLLPKLQYPIAFSRGRLACLVVETGESLQGVAHHHGQKGVHLQYSIVD